MNEVEQAPKIDTDNRDAEFSTLPQSLSDSYRKKMGTLLELSEEKKERLKKWLKKRLGEWKEDVSDLHARLQEDNDLVESVSYETDYPWSGASNVHVQVTETYMDVFRSVETRSILGADVIWSGTTDIDELRDQLADVEEAMNYKARNEWNIEKALLGVFWTTNRDGLGIVQATWCEQYEKVNDIAIIGNVQDFQMEFPSPEEAGIAPDEYKQLEEASRKATDESPLEIPITYEKQKYKGVKYDVVDFIDFVILPAWCPDIKDESCEGHGKKFTMNKGTVKKKGKDEVFYKDSIEDLCKKDGNSRGDSTYHESKDWVNGIKRTNKKNEYELFELVITAHLRDADEEEKYLVTYSLDHDILLGVMEYYYRADMYALFRIDSRPNQLGGKSLPNKTRDMNDEIDTQHNQRINIRTITSIPTFKAHTDLKQDPNFDPEAAENKWKPGRIFWSSKPELFDQFKIQPTDLGESLQEEANDMKILDLRLGSAASLLSGGVATGDPSAPGNKTAMMIQQSNLRMDTPLLELREGVSELGNISMSHYYQFGSSMVNYQKEEKGPDGKSLKTNASFPKKILRQGIQLSMKGVTVIDNPDAEMQRIAALYQPLMSVPEFANNPQARVTLWQDALRAGRIQNRDKYMPSLDQLKAQQVEIQKQAIMKMQQEKAMQEQAAKIQEQVAKEEMVKNNLAKAGQELRIKSTARKLAEASMGQEPMAEQMGPVMNGNGNGTEVTGV